MNKGADVGVKDISSIHQETGAAWNEVAANYERGEASDIAFLREGGNRLFEPERQILGDLSPWCQRAIHLQCSGGTDTLSLLCQGASEVVGVDISERMIAVARRKTEVLGANASWYCSDALQAPHILDGTADLVYTGCGALPWMMDIRAWAQVVARLLKPGGRVFVFEGHPLDWVWNSDAIGYEFDTERGDYFSEQLDDRRWPAPVLARLDLPEDKRPSAREHQWTLGQILNSLVAAGLHLEHFSEHPEPYWDLFPNMPEDAVRRLPHTFALLMSKPTC
ncbi:MAG TPA: class I SAM-dependent methyltransferase [Chthonomonadaceae bacterium]|nr:class I SAM-dependent methyltransferase [Chthonomonadaceae bacterium]